MNEPRFGRLFQPKCAVPGCGGGKDFRYCRACESKVCGKHFPEGRFAALEENRCPLCGSEHVARL